MTIETIAVPIMPMSKALEEKKSYDQLSKEKAEKRRAEHLRTVQEYTNRLMERLNKSIGSGCSTVTCYRKNANEPAMYRDEYALRDALDCIEKAAKAQGYKFSIYWHGKYYEKICAVYLQIP